jgi:hypothetical protein
MKFFALGGVDLVIAKKEVAIASTADAKPAKLNIQVNI